MGEMVGNWFGWVWVIGIFAGVELFLETMVGKMWCFWF